MRAFIVIALAIAAVASAQSLHAQSLYKYRGENGEWIYADRPPDDGDVAEVRDLSSQSVREGGVTVSYEFVGQHVKLTAASSFHAPVELVLKFSEIRGLGFPPPDDPLRWVLPPRSETRLVSLDLLETGASPYVEYRYEFLAGDPNAEHLPAEPYRVPFAISRDYPVTQAYPDVVTHTTSDSRHAVDIAMPIGTDIFAARDGIVFDVAGSNYRGGTDPSRDMQAANLVRILHDDGTYAIYAHLNRNSIRVRPGDRVARGEYIAESGNTGFSSGPHLHFAVVRNTGMRISSVPVRFMGNNSNSVVPASGMVLTAY